MNMTVPLDNGKYCITMKDNKITETRHGEPWRDLTGDNLMYYLLLRNAELECKIHELNTSTVKLADIKQCIKLAAYIREASWVPAKLNQPYSSKYLFSMDEATTQAVKQLNLSEELVIPISLMLFTAWNDILDWSKEETNESLSNCNK